MACVRVAVMGEAVLGYGSGGSSSSSSSNSIHTAVIRSREVEESAQALGGTRGGSRCSALGGPASLCASGLGETKLINRIELRIINSRRDVSVCE